MKEKIEGFLDLVRERNGNEPEFMQAVEEVAETVIPYIAVSYTHLTLPTICSV